MTDSKLLTSSERAAFALRSLYKQYGYLPFKMSKFEEYDLYVRNKDFLISDNVITFNDTDGRLLALKPDVTLSIIKNSSIEAGGKQKVYYNENVYRVSPKVHRFKEIMQAGLECVGDIDILDTFEAVELAAKSLSLVSKDFVLDVSHIGILSDVLHSASSDPAFTREATKLLAEKNRHELEALCRANQVSDAYTEIICSLVDMYGEISEVLVRLAPICESVGCMVSYSELEKLCMLLSGSEYSQHIRLDFSVVNDMSYYNGIVFRGFLNGIPDGVLAGGEYGKLMKRMGKAAGAVGFAIYLDMLDELGENSRDYDVDVLVIYNDGSDMGDVIEEKNRILAAGKSVSVMKKIPEKLRYKELIKLD